MYTHISMFRFRDRERLDAHRRHFRAQLEALPAHIPSIRTSLVTENLLPQPPLPAGAPQLFCDLVQILTFDTEEELAAYPLHPRHLAMAEENDHLVERVCIIDY